METLIFLALIGMATIGLAALCGVAYIVWLYAGIIFPVIALGIVTGYLIKGMKKRIWRVEQYQDDSEEAA